MKELGEDIIAICYYCYWILLLYANPLSWLATLVEQLNSVILMKVKCRKYSRTVHLFLKDINKIIVLSKLANFILNK